MFYEVLPFIKIAIILVICWWIAKDIYIYITDYEYYRTKVWKLGRVKTILLKTIILVASILFLFLNVGRSKQEIIEDNSKSQSQIQHDEFRKKDTTTIEQIREKTNNKIPEVLKRQETSDFQKEKEEADKYLNEVLKED